jgi:hypothetical protein
MNFYNFFLLLWVIFALLDPDPDPLTRLNPDPQPCLEDAACSLPVVLSCAGSRSSCWRPGLVAVTAFTIGLEEAGTTSLLLHSWQLLQPFKGTPEEGLAYRVLAKSCLVIRGGGSPVYFVRLARLASSGDSCEDYGGTLVVRLNDLADFPFIRPLASSLNFVESSAALLFEPDKEGQELLRRKSRHSGEPVMKLRQGVVFRVEEREEEECEESWEQLDDATVAAMREDEELNIRYRSRGCVALPDPWIFREKYKASDLEKVFA